MTAFVARGRPDHPRRTCPRPPVTPAGSSDVRRSTTAAHGPVVQQQRGPRRGSRARATAAGSAARVPGRVEPRADVARRRARGGRVGARSSSDRDAGGGGDAGRLDLGDHAAGADAGAAGAAESHAGQVGRRRARSAIRRAPGPARVGRRRARRRRRAGPARRRCTRCATSAASRSLSPKRISSVATVSFSLTTGTTPSASSR